MRAAAMRAVVHVCLGVIVAGANIGDKTESCEAHSDSVKGDVLLQQGAPRIKRELSAQIATTTTVKTVPGNLAAQFSAALPNTYLSGYAPAPYVFNSLADAMTAALTNSGCAGITQEKQNIYTLRSGATKKKSTSGETSWLKLPPTTTTTTTTTTIKTVPGNLAAQFSAALPNTALTGYAPEPNVFSSLADAMTAALTNSECAGVTQEGQNLYTLRSDATKKTSATGERSWLKLAPNPTASTCGRLELEGYIIGQCDAVPVGGSCQVQCGAGYEGKPVTFFCLAFLAARNLPPAPVAAPVCLAKGLPVFLDGEVAALSWGDPSTCIRCTSAWSSCQLVPTEAAGPNLPGPQCTLFRVNVTEKRIRPSTVGGNMCLHAAAGPWPVLWTCNSDGSNFEPKLASQYQHAAMCGTANPLCVNRVGLPDLRGGVPIKAATVASALTAISAGDATGFKARALALQHCKARFDAAVPQSFWEWLATQSADFRLALFSTFPVHSGQLSILQQIVQSVGSANFTALGLGSFAVSLAHTNRWKSFNDWTKTSHPGIWEDYYVKADEERYLKEVKSGMHTGISSNECNNLLQCCGPVDTWKFPIAKPPAPTVGEFVQWWVSTLQTRGNKLWGNPVNATPWIFDVYLWPSSLSDCQWVHRKLIDNEAMEGSWYLYDSSYHLRVCNGGKYHPNSIPGIAVYGGVCGRMSELEWRKRSCMGMPATQKGEPGHSAGISFKSVTGFFTTLIVSAGAPTLAKAGACLVCPPWSVCTTAPVGSSNCTVFVYDAPNSQIFASGTGQCLDAWGSQELVGLYGCGGTNANQRVSLDAATGEAVLGRANGKQKRLRTPSGGRMEPAVTRWEVAGFHEIECPKNACNFNSFMGLNNYALEATTSRHKEAALAAAEAYNDYPKSGLWPTAHDEARLAASMAHYLRRTGGASQSRLEAVLAWALRRNPAVYDAWLLAAEVNANLSIAGDSRIGELWNKLPSHKWFNELALFQGDIKVTSGAEHFARQHLLSPELAGHWRRYPMLLEGVVDRLCGSVSIKTIEELGAAGQPCLRLLHLAGGQNFQELLTQLLESADPPVDSAEANDAGNAGTQSFSQSYEVLSRLVLSGLQSEQATDLVNSLLQQLHVGHINVRSETFFAQNGRVLLRGPYAMALQLAGLLLPQSERARVAERVESIITKPYLYPSRMWSAASSRLAAFLQWLNRHVTLVRTTLANGTGNAHEESSVSDSFDGTLRSDGPNQEVMRQLKLDRDAELERGAALVDESRETGYKPTSDDARSLIRALLRLDRPDVTEPAGALLHEASKVSEASEESRATTMHSAPMVLPIPDNWFGLFDPQEMLKNCAEELVAAKPATYWG